MSSQEEKCLALGKFSVLEPFYQLVKFESIETGIICLVLCIIVADTIYDLITYSNVLRNQFNHQTRGRLLVEFREKHFPTIDMLESGILWITVSCFSQLIPSGLFINIITSLLGLYF